MANYYYDQNPETKASKLGPLQKETVPYYLKKLDKTVEENGGYFVGGQVSQYYIPKQVQLKCQ